MSKVIWEVKDMQISEKLTRVWPIVKWLDDARWNASASGSLIPGPVFISLPPPSQILTHWLCYITDQQRKWETVWTYGGQVFAEIAQQYNNKKIRSTQETLELLESFTESNGPRKVDTFKSKQQTIGGKKIAYRPRYGTHMLSIAKTLNSLNDFENNIIAYLCGASDFVFGPSSQMDDSPTLRMVFLLNLLSYDGIFTGLTSFHIQRKEFVEALERDRQRLNNLLYSKAELRNCYHQWIGRRFIKRLWAAFRDYVKPGSFHEPIFVEALRQEGPIAIQFINMLEQDRKSVLHSLEVPGDLWNLRFFQRLFGDEINTASHLRHYWKRLHAEGRLSDDFYPEQFDMSFDFTPRMCDQRQEHLCPFRNGSELKRLCLGNSGKRQLCPVIRILCGYESQCSFAGCPVAEGVLEEVCSGCR
jgi:hypothetical protein